MHAQPLLAQLRLLVVPTQLLPRKFSEHKSRVQKCEHQSPMSCIPPCPPHSFFRPYNVMPNLVIATAANRSASFLVNRSAAIGIIARQNVRNRSHSSHTCASLRDSRIIETESYR